MSHVPSHHPAHHLVNEEACVLDLHDHKHERTHYLKVVGA